MASTSSSIARTTTVGEAYQAPSLTAMVSTDNKAVDSIPSLIKHNAPNQWLKWLRTLRIYARNRGIWEKLDPSRPEHPDDAFEVPQLPQGEGFTRLIRKKLALKEEDSISVADRVAMFQLLSMEHQRRHASIEQYDLTIRAWIARTVNTSIYNLAHMRLVSQGKDTYTIKTFLKVLQMFIDPNALEHIQ